MKRNSAIVYDSWLEAAETLTNNEGVLGKTALALLRYCLRGIEYTGNDKVVKAVYIQAKPLVDSNNEKVCNGRKGGRPKKTKGFENEKTKGFENSETIVSEKSKTCDPENKKPYVDVDVDADADADVDVDVDVNSGTASSSSSNGASDEAVAESRKSKLEDVKLADSIIDLYNRRIAETGCRLRSCVAKTYKRRAMVLARLREHGGENVRAVIEKAVASHFLNYGTRNGDPMDIEWIFGRDNFPKVLEGKYDDRTPATAPKREELIESPFDDISDEDWTAMGGERRLATIYERDDKHKSGTAS